MLQTILNFFNHPVFWVIVIALIADFGTGTYRAVLEKRFTGMKLGRMFFKGFYYTVVYAMVHSFSLAFSTESVVEMLIVGVLFGKEFISVLQNMKAISILRGERDLVPGQEWLIEFMRLRTFDQPLQDLRNQVQNGQQSTPEQLGDKE